MKRKKKAERQDWQPGALIQVLRGVWNGALSLAKIALGGIATVVLIIVVCCVVVVGAAGDYLENDVIPNVTFDEEDYSLDQTSFIYNVDANGDIQLYEKINTSTDRQWATIDEIPEDLINAAIAIEDHRFYEHQGVDWITTVKACANMFFGGSDTFGGSTITQQLIKNLTGDNSVTVQRKVEEIFRAQKFEEENDKDTIMEWYLNTIYLGKLKYGVKSAAMYYFGKNLNELTTAECASLISITNNPSLYNPYVRPENNRARQEDVLWAMQDQGWITREEYEAALAQEMVFQKGDETQKQTFACAECGFSGEASAFDRSREDLGAGYEAGENIYYCPQCTHKNEFIVEKTSDVYSWYTEMVMDDVAYDLCMAHGDEWNSDTKKTYLELIKRSGYHIYTCIDTEVQAIVDEIYTNLDNVPDTKSAQQLLSAIVVIDNRTGDIVAVAGSVGEKTAFDATNHATEDDPKQTGSAMKPVAVYGPAFQTGEISPVTCLPDLPLSYSGGVRFPNNVNRRYNVANSVFDGIVDSNNTISVQTLRKIGLEYAFNFASEKFRIDGLVKSEVTESGREITDQAYAPLGLGALTYGVSVEDMANAYATFPNGGEFREARTYTKVYDSEGNLVLDNTQETEQILSEKANNYINYCLRGVVNNNSSVQLGKTAAAGKTGTTSDSRDRWFCGYTDYYTAAVWCGYKQPEEIKVTSGTGSNPACTMWAKVMKKLHADVEWREVSNTSGMKTYSICIDSGGYATDACSADVRGDRVQSVKAYSEDKPTKSCTDHIAVDWCVAGGGAATEYCRMAGAEIVKRGLVKYTLEEVENIKRAGNVKGFDDSIVYLLKGESGAPMKTCELHTAASVIPTPSEPETPAETTPAA